MKEIHINSKMGGKEPNLPGTEAPSIREFRHEELIAFYRASFPGMQPLASMNEAVKALQLLEDEYIKGYLSMDHERFPVLWARAICMILGMQNVVEKELGIGKEELNRAVSKLWSVGLNVPIK